MIDERQDHVPKISRETVSQERHTHLLRQELIMTLSPPPSHAKNGSSVDIGLGAQYVKDLSFENPNSPHVFSSTEGSPDLNVNVNIVTQGLAGNAYEVTLSIKAEAKHGGKTAYIVDLSYAGVFVMPDLPTEQLKLFLLVEAPRLMFPFARSIIANATRDGGFAPLMLAPVDFMAMYTANSQNVGTMPPAGAA